MSEAGSNTVGETDVDQPGSGPHAGWAFLEALRDAVYGVDEQGRCLFVNTAALRLLGYRSPAELLGTNMHDLIHHARADGSPDPESECPTPRVEGAAHHVTLGRDTLWRGDGTSFLARYSSYPLPGAPSGSSIITLEALAEGGGVNVEPGVDEGLDKAMLASSDCVFTLNANGRVADLNAAAASTFGFAPTEVVGRRFEETILSERSRTALGDRVVAALKNDTAALGSRIDVDARRADGGLVPVELTLFRAVTAGGPMLMVHLRDISARRREQQLARQTEVRFLTMANGLPQLSWMTQADGAVIWYNQRWYDYTGTAFADMAGWGWKDVHHPDHVDRVERRLRHSFDTGEPWEDTFPLRAADGGYGWFLSRAMPIRDLPDDDHPEGRVLGWLGTNTDITAIRDAEQKLEDARQEAEAANRAKSTFIANMSHELRTPLSAIIGYAEMLSEDIEDGTEPTDLARDVRKIEGNARHLLGLINDVLDLSKVESGKMEAYLETFDLADLAEEVASTVGNLLGKKRNRFELRLADGLGTMRSDVTRIRQMLINLLSNAAKFTEDGIITLSISRTMDRVEFAVEDTGIGMSEEQLAKLFQRFQQADASTTRQFGGTGLGLALTKAFAALLGGDIAVRSVKGQGSTFVVGLPATMDDVAEAASSGGAAGAEGADPAGRDIVLVIDDDETQRDLMSRFLLREGYAPRTASDGPTGVSLARRLKPRAILLDVTMPGMDGWSVLSTLKADPDLAVIPVVMVTFVSERALASSLGAADYVIKPVDWSRLRHVMEAFRDAEGDVLIVDDEDDMRGITRQALEKNGWSVVEAANGAEGLASVAHSIPRVILLDLNMPVMDGFEFLQALRAKPGCAGIPVVVLSALDLTVEDRRRLRGATQILNKGTTRMSELVEKLKRLETEGIGST